MQATARPRRVLATGGRGGRGRRGGVDRRLLSDPRQPPLQRTARESPVLEQMTCVGESNVITAVEPLWSLPVSTSGSARISACRFVLAAAIATAASVDDTQIRGHSEAGGTAPAEAPERPGLRSGANRRALGFQPGRLGEAPPSQRRGAASFEPSRPCVNRHERNLERLLGLRLDLRLVSGQLVRAEEVLRKVLRNVVRHHLAPVPIENPKE